jgi:hypothetical protein
LFWGFTPERADQAVAVAEVIAKAFLADTTCLDASQSNLETVLTVAREGQYSLTVIDVPPGEPLSVVLRQSSTPVLLVRDGLLTVRRILLVLRGHSPDESVLDWVIPLAQVGQAAVTLLTIAPVELRRLQRRTRMPQSLAGLLSPESEPGQHVMACARRLKGIRIAGQLKPAGTSQKPKLR